VKERLARYISKDLLNRGDGEENGIADDEDLLGSGLLDSLGVMSLVFFIETELKLDVPPEDVTIENFQSLRTIAAYLERRRP